MEPKPNGMACAKRKRNGDTIGLGAMPKPIAIGLRNSAGPGNSFRERGFKMNDNAISYVQAFQRLSLYGLSNAQARKAILRTPLAYCRDNHAYYQASDIDASADCLIDLLAIDDCGGD